ncbi:MAG: hypothetical protein H0T65_02325 [Deltaproteobacteria bacterium]|nr:hypothetical protein [Deltaproteobacteria bacterium]
MVTVAEQTMGDGHAVTAELRVSPAAYIYGVATNTLHNVHVDTIDGHVVSSAAAGSTTTSACPDSISISQAITIAEAQVPGGSVIAAIPDDDVACAREIQVLSPELLWEVKVGGAGEVLEVEESDEGGAED